MCGIWGAIQGPTGWQRAGATRNRDFITFARGAALAGTLRGWDSTGIAVADSTDGSALVHKTTSPGGIFVLSKDAHDMFDMAASTRIMFGHNRAATLGNIDNNTAHPFQHEHITLVHNGTVHGYRSDLGTFLGEYTPHNDSDAVAYAMSVAGWRQVLPKLTGAYALVWWDARVRRLMMARNSQRPMSIMFTEYDNAAYFASEGNMLRWLCVRDKITKEDAEVYNLSPGVVYSFDPTSNIEKSMEREEFSIATTRAPSYPKTNTPTTSKAKVKSTTGGKKPTASTSSEKLLADVGVVRGEILGFLPKGMEYNHQRSRHGGLVGEVVKIRDDGKETPADLEAIIYGLTREEGDAFIKQGWLEVKVTGVYKHQRRIITKFHSFGEQKTLTDSDVAEELAEEEDKDAICTFCGTTVAADAHQCPECGKEFSKSSERRYVGGGGELINEQQFLSLTSGGCCICKSKILPQDHESVEWTGVNLNFPVCAMCADMDWHKGP